MAAKPIVRSGKHSFPGRVCLRYEVWMSQPKSLDSYVPNGLFAHVDFEIEKTLWIEFNFFAVEF
ncbi:MAG: hypothetical protein ACI814_002399 [Mariniblastus sp.]|jgi:hypothetical protein